jgi:hypothetical protein
MPQSINQVHKPPLWNLEPSEAAGAAKEGRFTPSVDALMDSATELMEREGFHPAAEDKDQRKLYSEYFLEGNVGLRPVHLLMASFEEKGGMTQVRWYLCPPKVAPWKITASGRTDIAVVEDSDVDPNDVDSFKRATLGGASTRQLSEFSEAMIEYAQEQFVAGKRPDHVVSMDRKTWNKLQEDWNYRLWHYLQGGGAGARESK